MFMNWIYTNGLGLGMVHLICGSVLEGGRIMVMLCYVLKSFHGRTAVLYEYVL